jgi:quercetin dioxygenase-like cupin family protein
MHNYLPPPTPFKRGRSLNDATWYMGGLLTFLAEKAQTNGAFGFLEYLGKPGNEPPPHAHEREDELFYILEGEIDAFVGQQQFNLVAGECIFLPRLVPHGFSIRSARLRMLILLSPAGAEGYFREMSLPAQNLGLPAEALTYASADLEHVTQKCAQYGVRILSADEIIAQLPSFPSPLSR